MSKGILIVALVLVVFAALAAWFVGHSLEDEGKGDFREGLTFESSEVIARLRSIDDRLGRIEGSLSVLRTPATMETEQPPQDGTKTDSPRFVDPEIAALRRAIHELSSAIAAMPRGNEPEPLRNARRSEIDWEAWLSLWSRHQGNFSAIQNELLFLSRREILDRFGPPMSIETEKNSWNYWRSSCPAGEVRGATVRFHEGQVSFVSLGIEGK